MVSFTPTELDALSLSILVALWSISVSLPLGVGAAWLLSRKSFPGKSIVDGLIHLPLVVPPVVVGYLLLILLGTQGPIGGFLKDTFGITVIFTWKGAAVASAVMAFPLMVRAIRLSFDSVDRGLEEAAATLGASPTRIFFTITLPLILPGVIVGMILAFARSLGEFGATITFVSNIPGETQTLPLALFTQTQTPGGDASAIRLVVISVALALFALIISEVFSRRVARHISGSGRKS